MDISRWGLGLFISLIVGAVFISIIINGLLWGRIKQKYGRELSPTYPFSWLVGIVERILYVYALVYCFPEWIVFWLTFKIAVTWRWRDTEEQVVGHNVFLIGNALSIIFALFGAWIILGNLPILRFK
jgi:MFS family permease